MHYPLKVSKQDYHTSMVRVMNFLFNMSDLEMNIIITMLNHKILYLTKETRKILKDLLEMSENNFNNYIAKLRRKKVIVNADDNSLKLNMLIVQNIVDKKISVEYNIEE